METKFDRRKFHLLMGAVSMGLGLWGRSARGAEEQCGDLKEYDGAIGWDQDKIVVWIDGMALEQTDIESRGNIAILLKHPQGPDSYIDKVVLTDDSKKIVAARYYEAVDKMSVGYPPYLIFNSVNIGLKRFFLYIQVRANTGVQKYRYTLSEATLRKSRLNGPDIPARVRSELDSSHKGVISNPFYFQSTMGLANVREHVVRPKIINLSKDNQFTLLVDFFHPDENADHYMRYFIATDPVGRILGLVRRDFGDTTKSAATLTALTEDERNKWGLTRDRVAKITDCPYVMVFVEDVKHVIAKSTLWFR